MGKNTSVNGRCSVWSISFQSLYQGSKNKSIIFAYSTVSQAPNTIHFQPKKAHHLWLQRHTAATLRLMLPRYLVIPREMQDWPTHMDSIHLASDDTAHVDKNIWSKLLPDWVSYKNIYKWAPIACISCLSMESFVGGIALLVHIVILSHSRSIHPHQQIFVFYICPNLEVLGSVRMFPDVLGCKPHLGWPQLKRAGPSLQPFTCQKSGFGRLGIALS